MDGAHRNLDLIRVPSTRIVAAARPGCAKRGRTLLARGRLEQEAVSVSSRQGGGDQERASRH